jgi:uncharacterized protein (DUF1800 family)
MGQTAAPMSGLSALSARAFVGTGNNVLIGGFWFAGPGTGTVLLRASGPYLGSLLGTGGALAQPILTLYDSTGAVIATNEGWGNYPTIGTSLLPVGIEPATNALMGQVGASEYPVGSADSAMIVSVPPGGYTATVSGANGGTGIALVEVYTDQEAMSGSDTVSVTSTTAAANNSGGQPGAYTFTRIGDITQPLTISYSMGGSANSGTDYAFLPGTITFPAASATVTLALDPYPTINPDSTTTATLTLTPGGSYTIGPAGAATVTIMDLPPTLYVATLRPSASAGGSTASGTATILVNPDSTFSLVNVTFGNLSSSEVIAQIELGSPGQNPAYLFELPPGQVAGTQWTFVPAGPYQVADQLSALASGNVFLSVDTANYPSGELEGKFILSAGSQTFTAPPDPPALPADAVAGPTDTGNAVRLLDQGTFGPTMADISTVAAEGVTAWISSQMALPATSQLAAVQADAVAFPNAQPSSSATFFYTQNINREAAWWKIALTAPDQLRQRVAFALSEIFVVSNVSSALANVPEPLAHYYDLLANDAFGNFRQLLQDVTLSPVMGSYLNVLHNEKADAATGTSADENYARECQQLFTIGLVELQPDGTLQLDANGQPIPTYSQATIVQTANVFTGWSFASPNDNFFFNPLTAAIEGAPIPSTNAWLNPMQAYDSYHDTTAKTIVGGVVIAAGGTTTGDLKIELDTLFNHSNTGPFFCRQLIQRLVTSNPSPDYVYRVAQVFDDDGTGTRGNLAAVVKAILTDYEARSTTVAGDSGFGKLREPLLRVSGLLRAGNATSQNGRYIDYVSGASQNGPYLANPVTNFEEGPLQSQTVFNFFAPSHVVPGPLAAAGLVGPEFQISDAYSSITVPNALNTYVFNRIAPQPTNRMTMDLSSFTALAATPPALLDQVNLLFCGNAMTAATRARILSAIQALPGGATPLEIAQTALFLTLTSPEAAIQR